MEGIIRAVKLEKIYDTGKVKVDALRGVDIAITKGEMVAIMGPSGCGKTTLLNCLSGIDDPTTGEVYIEDILLSSLSDNKKTEHRARRMGFVFQFYNLLPVLTAVENVEMPLLLGGVNRKESRKKAMAILDTVGLKGWEEHVPAELSGGQRQRVTIARALVNEPAIVWADEPTGDLDSETSREIMDLLVELNKTLGQTTVVITHDPKVASRASRTILMESGRVANDGLQPEQEELASEVSS